MTSRHTLIGTLFGIQLALFSSRGLAATVLSSAPNGLVDIDLAGDASFRQGALVCFFNEAQKPVACGLVQSLNDKLGQVLVRADFLPRISVGMTARLAPAKLQPAPKTNPVKNEVKATQSSQTPETPPSKANQSPVPPSAPSTDSSSWSVHLGGLYIPQHLMAFHAVAYAAPINLAAEPVALGKVRTLWNREKEVSRNLRSAYNLELAYKSAWEYRLGLRTVLLGDYSYQSNYDLTPRPDDPKRLRYYADTAMSGQDYGLAFDLYPWKLNLGSLEWSFGLGLDASQSQLLLEMQRVDDTNGNQLILAQYTSTVRTLSLRFLNSARLQISNWDLALGLYLLAPTVSIFDTLTTISDPQVNQYLEGTEGETDLENRVMHDTQNFSAQISFSVGYQF